MTSLLDLRTAVRQRADRVNDPNVTDAELNVYINASAAELYDLVIEAHEEYAVQGPITFTLATNAPSSGDAYTLPSDFYKLRAIDKQDDNNTQFWITVRPFNFGERNKHAYRYPTSTAGNRFVINYRVMGNQLYLIPYLNSIGTYRFWYSPFLASLVSDSDTLPGYMSGPAWDEYIVVDCAAKYLIKQEDDPSAFLAQKEALLNRIIAASATRDEGDTYRVTDVYAGHNRGGSWGGGYGGEW